MIKRLKIHNYAIIKDVELEFTPHLIVITGETGAGKSILLGALNLVLGQRADTKSIGDLQDKCIVEAEFKLENKDLEPFFELHDLDFDQDLIIRREISPQGKSRAFINDTPVNLDILQTISNALIDIHQQFDTLDIYQVSTQLKMIDALAANKSRLAEYQLIFKAYQQARQQLEAWTEQLNRQQQEEEFIKFQFNELDELDLRPGELDTLETEQKELSHANEIKEVTGLFVSSVAEDDRAVLNILNDLSKRIQHLGQYHTGLEKLAERLNSVTIELEDVSDECRTIYDQVDGSPIRLNAIEERLHVLYKMMHKHKLAHADKLIDLKESFQQKLSFTDDLASKIAGLEKEIVKIRAKLQSMAEGLHERRLGVIPGFIEKIYQLIHPLGMEQTRVQINLKTTDTFNLTGSDEMEILLATNKGGAFLPIKNIASGGELARFNLVTKSLVAQAIPLPSLIFDEIDIGISGDVALKMGQILKELAEKHQVICITHSPQIASKGEVHYYVYKDDSAEKTVAQVKRLNKSERIQAIATMLSSNPPSAAAVKNAKELIEIE
ncbi:MAG: DNA repair protein RecN [Saprospiraceae bacterium]|nr:DNA repair protein RecN [Saprospiraceae bacterium]